MVWIGVPDIIWGGAAGGYVNSIHYVISLIFAPLMEKRIHAGCE